MGLVLSRLFQVITGRRSIKSLAKHSPHPPDAHVQEEAPGMDEGMAERDQLYQRAEKLSAMLATAADDLTGAVADVNAGGSLPSPGPTCERILVLYLLYAFQARHVREDLSSACHMSFRLSEKGLQNSRARSNTCQMDSWQ